MIAKVQKFIGEVLAEMKKVSWTTRRELVDSTLIVIFSSFLFTPIPTIPNPKHRKCLESLPSLIQSFQWDWTLCYMATISNLLYTNRLQSLFREQIILALHTFCVINAVRYIK